MPHIIIIITKIIIIIIKIQIIKDTENIEKVTFLLHFDDLLVFSLISRIDRIHLYILVSFLSSLVTSLTVPSLATAYINRTFLLRASAVLS